MFAVFKSAGWPIWFLLITSIVCVAVIIERYLALKRQKVMPDGLAEKAISDWKSGKVDEHLVTRFKGDSPLGEILAAGLAEAPDTAAMRDAMEDAGRTVALKLEKFLTTLGTIAALAPLLGLFGTVVGMIEIFGSHSASGTDPVALAHGISVALYNTGFGLLIAMPALVFYRHFRSLVNAMLTEMESKAAKFVNAVSKAGDTK